MPYLILGLTQGNGRSFHTTLGTTTDNVGLGVTSPHEDIIYVSGYTVDSGNNFPFIAKYTGAGSLQWQRQMNVTGTNSYVSVATDSSGNVYTVGRRQTGVGSTSAVLLAKYNSFGTIQWHRILDQAGIYDAGHFIAVDGSDVYITGRGNNIAMLAKYNSSGVIQWQRTYGTGAENVTRGVSVDSSGNAYIVKSSDAGANDSAVILKYDSTGTLLWQRDLAISGVGFDVQGLAGNAAGDIAVVGHTQGTASAVVAMCNSTGTLQWSRQLSGGGNADVFQHCRVDGDGNVYTVGYTSNSGAGGIDVLLTKYNSAGVIQWQRTLGGTGDEIAYDVSLCGSSSLVISGYTTSDGEGLKDVLVAKVPVDGTETGTVGNLTYSSISFTDSAGGIISSTPALSANVSTLVDTAGSLTDEAGTMTSTTY